MKRDGVVTGGCNNEPKKKKNKQNKGMVCDGVSAYVCVLPLYVRVCACMHVSSQDSTREHTHTLVIVITSLFL